MPKYKLKNIIPEDVLQKLVIINNQKIVFVRKDNENQIPRDAIWVDLNTVQHSNRFSPNKSVVSDETERNNTTNVTNSKEVESTNFMTESGEIFSGDIKIPESVLEKAKNISILYDDIKKEYYLEVK